MERLLNRRWKRKIDEEKKLLPIDRGERERGKKEENIRINENFRETDDNVDTIWGR